MVNRSRVLAGGSALAALFVAAAPADATVYTLVVSGHIMPAVNADFAYDLTDRLGLFTTAGQSLAGKAFKAVYRIDTTQGWQVNPAAIGSNTTVYVSGINPYFAYGEAITASVTIGSVTVRDIGVGGSTIPAGADTQSMLALGDGVPDRLQINTGISDTSYISGGRTITGFNIRVNNGFDNAETPGVAITTGGTLEPFAFDWASAYGNGQVSFAGNGLATTYAYFQPTAAVLTAGVPEPASWVMMVSGFGLAGTAMRRRKGRRASAIKGS